MSGPEIALLLFGLVMLLAPLELARDLRRVRRRTAVAEGRVVEHVAAGSTFDAHGTMQYGPGTRHARIVFEVDGRSHECVAGIGASWIVHELGATVAVRYDPLDPANADVAHGPLTLLAHRAVIVGFPLLGATLLAILVVRLVG